MRGSASEPPQHRPRPLLRACTATDFSPSSPRFAKLARRDQPACRVRCRKGLRDGSLGKFRAKLLTTTRVACGARAFEERDAVLELSFHDSVVARARAGV